MKQTTTGGAETVFSLGEDSSTFFRFAKIDGNRTPGAPTEEDSLRSNSDVAADPSFLFFQIKIGGVLSSLNIPYDPVLHRFWRFRHQKEDNTINFETSPGFRPSGARQSFSIAWLARAGFAFRTLELGQLEPSLP